MINGEFIIFLQGDDATEIFHNIMYPVGKSAGTRNTLLEALNHLKEWDLGEPTRVEEVDINSGSGSFAFDGYVMVWSYAYNWIGLWRKVSKKYVKELELQNV